MPEASQRPCGRRDEALAFLKRAIDSGFCGWPGLDRDPIADVREDDRFRRLREQAIACHRRFREAVEDIAG